MVNAVSLTRLLFLRRTLNVDPSAPPCTGDPLQIDTALSFALAALSQPDPLSQTALQKFNCRQTRSAAQAIPVCSSFTPHTDRVKFAGSSLDKPLHLTGLVTAFYHTIPCQDGFHVRATPRGHVVFGWTEDQWSGHPRSKR